MYIRSTFALDDATARGLESLARKWRVSKSEALRRAVARAQEQPGPGGEMSARDALNALARNPPLSRSAARNWRAANAAARRASEESADRRAAGRVPRPTR